jgi:hypothetical protein
MLWLYHWPRIQELIGEHWERVVSDIHCECDAIAVCNSIETCGRG